MKLVSERLNILRSLKQMAENFTERYKQSNYAIYLPSLQSTYAQYCWRTNKDVARKAERIPKKFKTEWLNFLDENSKLWHCGYCLYSAGQFDNPRLGGRDIVAERDRSKTTIVGDSGGFQLGTGAISNSKEKAHLERYKNDPQAQFEKWHESGFRERTLKWLERNTDYAMTLDIVLWATESLGYEHTKKSQLRKLSVQQMIDLSVDNLRYFADNRGLERQTTKFLNVLQDVVALPGSGEAWYNAVKDFDFEGYALGSDTGRISHSIWWLRRLLNEGKLDKAEWVHLLMKSPPINSVVYTAIQRALRTALGRDDFTISLDSSSPSQMAGKQRAFARNDKLTSDMKTWVIGNDAMKQDIRIARGEITAPIPHNSPLNEYMTLYDLCAHAEDYSDYFVDRWSEMAMVNHNMWAFHTKHFEACDLVFDADKQDFSRVPQQLADAVELIEQYFLGEKSGEVEQRLTKILESYE